MFLALIQCIAVSWYDNFQDTVFQIMFPLLTFQIISWPDATWLLYSMHVHMTSDRWLCSNFVWKITDLEVVCEEIINNEILLTWEFTHLGKVLPSMCISAASWLLDQIWFMLCQLCIETELVSISLHKIMQIGLCMSIQLLSLEYQKDIIDNIFRYGYMSEDSDYNRKYLNMATLLYAIFSIYRKRVCLEAGQPTPHHICHDSTIRSAEYHNRKP